MLSVLLLPLVSPSPRLPGYRVNGPMGGPPHSECWRMKGVLFCEGRGTQLKPHFIELSLCFESSHKYTQFPKHTKNEGLQLIEDGL